VVGGGTCAERGLGANPGPGHPPNRSALAVRSWRAGAPGKVIRKPDRPSPSGQIGRSSRQQVTGVVWRGQSSELPPWPAPPSITSRVHTDAFACLPAATHSPVALPGGRFAGRQALAHTRWARSAGEIQSPFAGLATADAQVRFPLPGGGASTGTRRNPGGSSNFQQWSWDPSGRGLIRAPATRACNGGARRCCHQTGRVKRWGGSSRRRLSEVRKAVFKLGIDRAAAHHLPPPLPCRTS